MSDTSNSDPNDSARIPMFSRSEFRSKLRSRLCTGGDESATEISELVSGYYFSAVVWYSDTMRFIFNMVDLKTGRVWKDERSITLSAQQRESALQKYPHLSDSDAIAKFAFGFERAYLLSDNRIVSSSEYWQSMPTDQVGRITLDIDNMDFGELAFPPDHYSNVKLHETVKETVTIDRALYEHMLFALRTVSDWSDFPDTGKTYNDGSPISYGAQYGSDGERDYMRAVVRQAIHHAEGKPFVEMKNRR